MSDMISNIKCYECGCIMIRKETEELVSWTCEECNHFESVNKINVDSNDCKKVIDVDELKKDSNANSTDEIKLNTKNHFESKICSECNERFYTYTGMTKCKLCRD